MECTTGFGAGQSSATAWTHTASYASRLPTSPESPWSLIPPSILSAVAPVSSVRLHAPSKHNPQSGSSTRTWGWGMSNADRRCVYRKITHMRMTSITGVTNILPSPISPVFAAAHIICTTVSTCVLQAVPREMCHDTRHTFVELRLSNNCSTASSRPHT